MSKLKLTCNSCKKEQIITATIDTTNGNNRCQKTVCIHCSKEITYRVKAPANFGNIFNDLFNMAKKNGNPYGKGKNE
jgi:hypothetical protein